MASVFNISFHSRLRLLIIVPLLGLFNSARAQVCTDPANVVYGLTNSGFIYPVNVNTGAVGSAINPSYPGNAPDQSNGLAYNQVSGKFYYFKRIPSSSIIEFISFDPATNTYTMLSSPSTTSSVYSGSITNDGTGYYCWDTQGRLFYYKIATNTWTTITSSLVDQYGKDVDSIIRAHASGDGAIDGNGNLWILPSSDTRYGLFRLNGPLPTTPVASLTVQQIVAMTPPPSKFVGIAFTVSGEIFMCAANSSIYRLEDNLSLALMSTMSINMGDLTSCNFPLAVLAANDVRFNAVLRNGNVLLSWNAASSGSVTYIVERSGNNSSWEVISNASQMQFSANGISFMDESPFNGKNYYRLKIVSVIDGTKYSLVKSVIVVRQENVTLWPNPATSKMYIQNGSGAASLVIYDPAGRKIKFARLTEGINALNLSSVKPGRYIVSIQTGEGNISSYKIIKN